MIWYRDEHGVKRTRYIDRAEVPYYVLKDKESEEAISPPMFIERDKVEKHITYSDNLFREIALKTDSMAYYDRAIGTRAARSNLKNLLKHNYIYDSDMDVTDRYVKNFMEEFEPDINYKLHKTYFDIETDLMPNGFKDKGYIGFPDEDIAPCPINIISFFDSKAMIEYSFILRNPLNKSLIEFEKNVEVYKQELKDWLREEDDVILNDLVVNFYNSEEETIEAFLNTLHKIDPDLLGAWNSGFDWKTIMNRLQHIYKNKKDLKDKGIRAYDQMLSVVCDQKYSLVKNKHGEDLYLTPKAYYKQNKDKSIVDRMDEFTVLDGIFHADQMLLYANIRKATVKESYSLDAIANEELGKEKLDYTGYTIKNLAWKNFPKLFKYSNKDTILLHLLESKNLDVDMVQKLCEVTNTRKYKVFKKTVSIKNFVCKFAEMQGYVMGNNKNAQYGDDGQYFEDQFLSKKNLVEYDNTYLTAFAKKENFGAFVGNPMQNDYQGVEDISGNKSMFLFKNVFDEDFSALYPSIIRSYNLDKNSQVGKFFLVDDHIKQKLLDEFGYDGLFAVSKNEEADADSGVSSSDLGPTLIDSLISHNWSRVGEKYFDLKSTTEMINELKEMKKNRG